MPRFGDLRDWQNAINPIKRRSASLLLFIVGQLSFGAPASRTALEDVAVMEKPIEHRGDSGGITQEFAPVFNGSVRGEDRARPFVAAHDDLEQIFGGSCG